MLKFLDFWFADFSWYRKLTDNKREEWLKKTTPTELGVESQWVRLPKGTYLMMQVVNQLMEDEPRAKELLEGNEMTDEEKRSFINKYLEAYYGQDETEEDLG